MSDRTQDLRRRLSDLRSELRARRVGRKALPADRSQAIREITGATGAIYSNGFDTAAKGADAFTRSFEPRIPPSIHISHRDSIRHGTPIPVSERCLEDWPNKIEYADPYDELMLGPRPPRGG